MADTQAFEVAVAQVIEDSERLHKVVNGSGLESVVTEDGSEIPSVRKAMLENVYFKTPPLPWTPGTSVTVFNQLYAYTNAGSVQWWYAPGASISTPVSMPANPNTSSNWRLYVDSNVMATLYAKLESPIFTGNPQAPTPNITSNSTTIATTEFVVTAIQNALSEAGSGTVTYSNVISTDLIRANDLTVNGTTTINGLFDASNQDGRFANLILTKEASKLSFEWSDANNPSFTKTAISPYNVVTHRLATDLIVNGKANSDATVISLMGNGNNQMDYLKVVGNSERPVTDPRLEVVGLTKLENLQITGQISGISFGIDGTDIKPNSVAVSKQLTVGTDITVTGKADIGGPLTTNELVATGTSAFEVVTVSESITIAADAVTSLLGDLTVAGDVSLGGTSGTTRVNNLIVQGTVSGINFDLSDQDAIMNSILVKGQSTLSGGVLVSGDSTLASQDTETGDWSGTTIVNDLTIHGEVTGLPAPDLTGQDLSVANLTASASGLEYGGALTSNLVISGASTRRVTLQHYLNPGVDENALLTVLVGDTATNYLFNNAGYGIAPSGWTTASDERIKKDITVIDDPLGKMKLIKGCTWTRVDVEGTGIGFIAQDVQKAFPDSVINLGNRQLPDGTVVKGLLAPDTPGVAAALHHEAILTLMDKIEKQDAIIAELQSRMKAIDGLEAYG